MSELDALRIPAWTKTVDGNNVQRAVWRDMVEQETADQVYFEIEQEFVSMFGELRADINAFDGDELTKGDVHELIDYVTGQWD